MKKRRFRANECGRMDPQRLKRNRGAQLSEKAEPISSEEADRQSFHVMPSRPSSLKGVPKKNPAASGIGRLVLVLSLCCMACSIAEWVVDPPASVVSVVFSVVHVAALLVMPLFPRVASWMIIANFVLYCLLPDAGGPSQFWGVWFVLLYQGYEYPWYIVAGSSGLCFLAAGVGFWEERGTLSGCISMLFVFLFVAGGGHAWRWHEDAHQKESADRGRRLAEERLEAVSREKVAALKIHDEVSSKLSAVILLLDSLTSDSVPDPQETPSGGESPRNARVCLSDDEVALLRDAVRQALVGTRESIAFLQTDGTQISQGCRQTSGADVLQKPLHAMQQRLATVGFRGDVTMEVPQSVLIGRDVAEKIFALLKEIEMNICLHADASNSYFVSLRAEGPKLLIESSNKVASAPLFADRPASGKGLALHASAVKSVGGELHYGKDREGIWHLCATFPCVE